MRTELSSTRHSNGFAVSMSDGARKSHRDEEGPVTWTGPAGSPDWIRTIHAKLLPALINPCRTGL